MIKQHPLLITDAMLDAVLEANLVMYKYIDCVEAKGPDGLLARLELLEEVMGPSK